MPSGTKLGILCVAALLFGLGAAAPQNPDTAGDIASHIVGFDHIQTDKVGYDLNTGDFSLPEPFTAERQGTTISADQGNGNSKQKLMHAKGHVVLHQTRQIENHGQTTQVTQRPSTLTCDKLDVDGLRKIYVATGNMHFTQEGGREANSDTAVLDDANHHLHMQGHVHVRNGEATIDADTLDYDTLSGELLGNGNVTITSPIESPPPGLAPAPRKKRRGLL